MLVCKIAALTVEDLGFDDTHRLVFSNGYACLVPPHPPHPQRYQAALEECSHIWAHPQPDKLDTLVSGQIRKLVFDALVEQDCRFDLARTATCLLYTSDAADE